MGGSRNVGHDSSRRPSQNINISAAIRLESVISRNKTQTGVGKAGAGEKTEEESQFHTGCEDVKTESKAGI